MFDFTQERVLNDLSAVSVIDDTVTLAAPGIATITGSTSGGIIPANTYFYVQTAVTAKGETTKGTQSTVTNTGATSSNGLAWTAVTGTGIIGYNVYRGTTTGVVFFLAFTPTNAYTDTGAVIPSTVDVPPSVNSAYIVTDQGVFGTKALVIQRLNKYLASNLSGPVYKRAASAPVNTVGTITMPSTGVAGTYRLEVDVTMSGSYPIDYDRWAINKGKPFFVEVALASGPGTATAFATALVPSLQKGLKKYNGQNITDIVITDSGTGNVVITASNEYQRFLTDTSQKLEIQLLDATGENYTPVATGTLTTQGVEGFGTAWFITKNLRLPTQEATRFFGTDQDERPINGVMYNQYTFAYSALRNFSGVGAVGTPVTSKTTHVLYVPTTLAATFEGYLTSAFGAGSMVDAQSNLILN
jgi:hypothetical protein